MDVFRPFLTREFYLALGISLVLGGVVFSSILGLWRLLGTPPPKSHRVAARRWIFGMFLTIGVGLGYERGLGDGRDIRELLLHLPESISPSAYGAFGISVLVTLYLLIRSILRWRRDDGRLLLSVRRVRPGTRRVFLFLIAWWIWVCLDLFLESTTGIERGLVASGGLLGSGSLLLGWFRRSPVEHLTARGISRPHELIEWDVVTGYRVEPGRAGLSFVRVYHPKRGWRSYLPTAFRDLDGIWVHPEQVDALVEVFEQRVATGTVPGESGGNP